MLSVGTGIGVNTVVFSWILAAVLQPLPGVSRAGDLYWIQPRTDTGMHPELSWLEYRDLRAQVTSFEALLAFRLVPLYVGEAGRTERAYGVLVSDNYFAALGLRPALGRFLAPGEVARPGGARVLVVSHRYWQTRLGGSPDALGRKVRVNGAALTVVGVAPRGFNGTVPQLAFDLFLPATLAPVLQPGARATPS